LAFSSPPTIPVEILLVYGEFEDLAEVRLALVELEAQLCTLEDALADHEVALILQSLPLLKEVSPPDRRITALSEFALIWRDHFLEENIALLQAFERAGIPPKWIFALSKGDQTAKSEQIDAYFRRRGYVTDLLDSGYQTPGIERSETARIKKALEEFIDYARSLGKKVLAIDDGGILFNCFRENQRIIDYAVEVTVGGTKRLRQLPSIDIPVYDVGRSKLKKIVTYPEIAESGVMRVREMIRAEKLRGRSVLILGYGDAGRHIARVFHSLGCRVSVVDTKMLPLVEAAENGFRTYRTAYQAIVDAQPFLLFGCSGEVSLTISDFDALPDGSFVTAIATKDLSILRQDNLPYDVIPLPDFGYEYRSAAGKRFYQLGDGRSFNLYRSEAIPNRANDVFKTAIFVVANSFAETYQEFQGGLYVEEVDDAIEESGLLELYYDMYLVEKDSRTSGMNG
jgi:adenosylhomocysteinase